MRLAQKVMPYQKVNKTFKNLLKKASLFSPNLNAEETLQVGIMYSCV